MKVLCEDEVERLCYQIEPSYIQKHLFSINWNEPSGGYLVHALTIAHLLKQLAPPTKEQRAAATRLWTNIALVNLNDIHEAHRKGKKHLPFDFE